MSLCRSTAIRVAHPRWRLSASAETPPWLRTRNHVVKGAAYQTLPGLSFDSRNPCSRVGDRFVGL